MGTRSGKLINLHDANLKTIINDVSVDQTADSHPDSTEEARTAANAVKFRLDLVQIRAFELKTFSNLLRVHKELKRVKVNHFQFRHNFSYKTALTKATIAL